MSHAIDPIRATDPLIKTYYADLKAFAEKGVTHEGATETAFGRLLNDTAAKHGWLLVPKQAVKVKGKARPIFPDGTLRDVYNLARGYWEAKDEHDDLEEEVRKKIEKQYPLTNTIFEDDSRAILYQNDLEHSRYDLTKAQQVADLLTQFYTFSEPDIEGFERAVEEFSLRVPELAAGLAEKITEAHAGNIKFKTAYEEFFRLCQSSIDPNITRETVDEMLVQHLLTERLFRTIFEDPDFIQRNVIAGEVEKVIEALVSKSFSRVGFLKSLDKYYKAIEKAAESIEEFEDKQHFLNSVYERFFQGYSTDAADTHGIVYTPQQIVDFMCQSVEETLRTEFNQTLGSPDVKILDPCTGTGNYLVNLIRRVPGKDLLRVYKEQLFANEIMLLAYYIASLNIEHAYTEKAGQYEAFEGLCFADTLDLTPERQPSLFGAENAERVRRQKFTQITVIIGNPPYNVGQVDENEDNQNRDYEYVDARIKQTYVKDSRAKLAAKQYDAYVRFFRWAVDRLQGRDGIVCFVTNNNFVEKNSFDGFRKHMLKDFTRIYHLDLQGGVRANQELSGTAYNVFGIQLGVGITLAVRIRKHDEAKLYYHSLDKKLRRSAKLEWLTKAKSMTGVPLQQLQPDTRGHWFATDHGDVFAAFIPVGSSKDRASKTRTRTIFKDYSPGVSTNRDRVAYDFDRAALESRVEKFCKDYSAELYRYDAHREADPEKKFTYPTHIKWSESLKRALATGQKVKFRPDAVRTAMFRPFTKMDLYYAKTVVDRPGHFARYLPTPETDNRIIVVSDVGWRSKAFSTLCCRVIPDLHVLSSLDGHQCFRYLYSGST
ncbi:MAG: hypothetical protein JWO38_6763 [Gemmataceae bacterium]|nr:hypothetical protein [Gemmataceae bacterium]